MITPLDWLLYWMYEAQSLKAFQAKDWRTTIECCNKALQVRPRNSTILGMRGIAYRSINQFEQAITDLSQVVELSPTGLSYRTRADAYRAVGDFERSIADLNMAIQLNPRHSFTYAERGHTYREKGDFTPAIADFEHAISLFPEPEYYCQLADVQLTINDWDGALKTWQEGLNKTYGNANIYLSRGTAYAKRGEHTLARADLENAMKFGRQLEDRKTKSNFYFQLAGIYQEILKDYDTALRLYKVSSQYDPSESTNYLNIGWIYLQKRDYDTALVETQKALARSRKQDNKLIALSNLGSLFALRGNIDQAHSYWGQALAHNSEYPAVYANRSGVYLKQNRFAEAVSDAETAFKLKPDEPAIISTLAIAHYAAGNIDKALEVWRSLLQIEPNYNNLEWIKTEKIWFDWTLPYAEKIIAHLNGVEGAKYD
jgi:tetratricopeptide (TPR) repeat protein